MQDFLVRDTGYSICIVKGSDSPNTFVTQHEKTGLMGTLTVLMNVRILICLSFMVVAWDLLQIYTVLIASSR